MKDVSSVHMISYNRTPLERRRIPRHGRKLVLPQELQHGLRTLHADEIGGRTLRQGFLRGVIEGVEGGAKSGPDKEDISWAEGDILRPDDRLKVAQWDNLSGKSRDGDIVLGGPGGVIKENTTACYTTPFGPC